MQSEPAPAPQPKRYLCRHIFPDGHRCAALALRNQPFCYWHHTTRRPAAGLAARRQQHHAKSSFHLEIPDDRNTIQHAIGTVLQRIAANQLDPRRAGLMLYGLQIAALNLQRAEPTRHSQKPPATQPARSAEPVEEIISHPDLGILAPESEFLPAEKKESFAQLFMAEWRRHQAQADAQTEPDPVTAPSDILPAVQACTSQQPAPTSTKKHLHPEAQRSASLSFVSRRATTEYLQTLQEFRLSIPANSHRYTSPAAGKINQYPR